MKICEKCGKEMVENAAVCPNCGVEVQPPKLAKRARLFGILSLVALAPFGIAGIICAVKSKKETGGVFCKPAKAGFIMSIIGLAAWALYLLMFL